MATLLWLEGGACSGNTVSFLNAEEPTAVDLVTDFGIEVIWHPSLGMELGDQVQQILRECASGERQVDIFVFEGSVLMGPEGSGRYDMFAERPMKDWVAEIAPRAGVVVAVGDCSAWGGIPATPPNPTDDIGLQYMKGERGGFLGKDFTGTLGLPVVNIPGCPAHPDWITQIVVALAAVGPLLVRHLWERGVPEGVELVDGGAAGLDVAFKMRGRRTVVIVDAASTGSEPGTLYRVPGEALENLPPMDGINQHAFRWDHALAVGRWLLKDDYPRDVVVFLIEAQSTDPGADLTPAVEAGMERAIELVLEEVCA